MCIIDFPLLNRFSLGIPTYVCPEGNVLMESWFHKPQNIFFQSEACLCSILCICVPAHMHASLEEGSLEWFSWSLEIL